MTNRKSRVRFRDGMINNNQKIIENAGNSNLIINMRWRGYTSPLEHFLGSNQIVAYPLEHI